ncbi:Stf0 family sulfotransferase [Paenibacillus sp. UNC496MF]|uniref:Stf0 family sulfotransferase n=1 Tax=Paenibacillus sp. UNC496MF TaxID=1502753 RepID=UPI0035297BE9
MKPKQSYAIWFAQRTGSTLLHRALASTGMAGDPGEWSCRASCRRSGQAEYVSSRSYGTRKIAGAAAAGTVDASFY